MKAPPFPPSQAVAERIDRGLDHGAGLGVELAAEDVDQAVDGVSQTVVGIRNRER